MPSDSPDWPLIMRELSAAGYSRRIIQTMKGVHRDRCQKIAHGARPYYDEAVLLLELHLHRSERNLLHDKLVAVAHLRQGSDAVSRPLTAGDLP